MKHDAAGYQVAVLGSSSLLGRELLSLLTERKFPIASLREIDAEQAEAENSQPQGEELALQASLAQSLSSYDFVFIAGGSSQELRLPETGGPTVISLTGNGVNSAHAPLSIPFLDQAAGAAKSGRRFIVPHAATMVLSTLLLRFGARFSIETAVGTVFTPASESGSHAIEELHKQTANVLSFQKLPKEVFGAQLAFNLLPRLAGKARAGAEKLENRVRSELHNYLEGRAPLPALRLIQVPAFYSIAVSLYLQTSAPIPAELDEEALGGEPVRICPATGQAPSAVGAAGSSEILVDAVQFDAGHPEGVWIWAVADNLRLAAENAIRIAEGICAAGKR